MEKSPIYLSNTDRTNVRVMKREIDALMDTYKLKVEFQKDKIYLQAIKKNHWKIHLSYSKETFTTLISSITVSNEDAGGFPNVETKLLCLETGSSR